MKPRLTRLFGVSALLLVALALTGETVLEKPGNSNDVLRGDYALTLAQLCAGGKEGLGSALTRSTPGTFMTLTIRGILSYNGDGTGSFKGQQLYIGQSAADRRKLRLAHEEINCKVTYAVGPKGTVTQDMSDCSITVLAGHGIRETIMQTGIRLEGQIAKTGGTLIFSDTAPNPETLTLVGHGTFRRICGRSGSAVEM